MTFWRHKTDITGICKGIKNKKLKGKLQQQEEKFRLAAKSAAKAEILYTEEAGYLEAEGLEKTYNFRQDQLVKEVDLNTSKKVNVASLRFRSRTIRLKP